MTVRSESSVTAALAARQRLADALRTRDLDAISQLLADDLVVNAPINKIVDRDDLLGRVERGEAHRADPATTTRIEYAQARNGAVVIMGEETIDADSGPIRRRFTDIWRPHDDSWQLTICQITTTAAPPTTR